MKIAVAGLWHLGCVTAACLAKAGYEIIAYDPDSHVVNHLPPIHEPGLDALIKEGIAKQQLKVTHDLQTLSETETLWVTFDTPVNDDDIADTNAVLQQIHSLLPILANNALVIISSQLPAGTIKNLKRYCDSHFPEKNIHFACIPENLRLGKAIEIFEQPDRIIVGLDNDHYRDQIITLLSPFSSHLIFMSTISAEMVKHAINGFLALSVTYSNEIATLAEKLGANSKDIERAMKSESRIGSNAYVRPGASIGGGTLMRDIHYLTNLSHQTACKSSLINAAITSNEDHQAWTCRKLTALLKNIKGKKVAMLGLTYKAGTDTLRRSTAIATCTWLHEQGADIQAFDPLVQHLPTELAGYIHTNTTIHEALQDADAVIVATEWPQFQTLTADDFKQTNKSPLIIDPNRFIAKNIEADPRIKYYSVGVPA